MRSPTSSPILSPTSLPSIWPLILTVLLIYLAQALYTLPINRVIEFRLCQEHYSRLDPSVILDDGSIPEKLCKIDDVQRKLAWLQGVMETTQVVGDFLVTIPFSFVAEKFGIRTVLWCNLVPRVFLSVWALVVGNFSNIFPTKAIIVGPFLSVLGGECVFQSTIFTLTSALTREYVQRASHFSYISSVSYVVNFIGPTLASLSMNYNLWCPFFLNIALLLCAIPVIGTLPHPKTPGTLTSVTARGHQQNSIADDEAGPLLEGQNVTDYNPNRYANAFEATPNNLLRTSTQTIKKLIQLIVGRRNFQVLLCSFFLTALASSDTKLLVQYISKRYEWTFAQAGYMLSAKAIVNFTLLAIIVPRVIRRSMAASKPHHHNRASSPSPSSSSTSSEIRINYLGAQASIIISIIGVFLVALAFKFWMLLTALIIYALGSALPVFTMSLVKSPLIALPSSSSPTSNADASSSSDVQDFSIVMLTKTLGSLVGAPLMAALWVAAMRVGGMGLGLPYLVSGCIYACAACVVGRLRF
ncbi:hypothetical protein DM02DRAFT_259293 [Periconia macrospinosa]|uniref:MFS general substrate transporter n=1 Tax=Periconia macrospinosa TaxID=97972 RepID=A0A2V1D4J8_9PLEO|nr:hypothetical protein DM02DRAFT_259293 [Periconia macrospinosa]